MRGGEMGSENSIANGFGPAYAEKKDPERVKEIETMAMADCEKYMKEFCERNQVLIKPNTQPPMDVVREFTYNKWLTEGFSQDYMPFYLGSFLARYSMGYPTKLN